MSEYQRSSVEKKWQDAWEEWELYRFDPDSDAEPYTIDNPPRYASGALHIGHAVHYTHIDFAARYKRMRGYNVMFPLCFDVNGMPIEVNVEKKYGIKMRDTDRHEFIKMCRDFAGANIGEMKRQFKILGHSMDPSVYYQTDADYYRRITQLTFLDMYKKGYVYKGERPINWCPRCGTALADAEVEYRERKTALNYIKFRETDTGRDIIIATTRPELLCACKLIAVHPGDERYADLVGKRLKTPIYDVEVEVVADEKVDPEFGTGVVMICTIGDKDDLEWIFRYGLKIEKSIDERGRMTDIAGKYAGMDIIEARKAIIDDMNDAGLLVKQQELEQTVGTCWRCHTPLEFLQVPQWFFNILDHKETILKAADEMDWFPDFMKVRLRDWVKSLNRDWVISRQRYFATPIPVWECMKCGHIILAEEEQCYADPTIDDPPVERCPECGGDLKGCEDVFDTWVDSSITALYNTFWSRDERMFKKLYPMSLRPQSHDIIRTWAFYSIYRGTAITGEKPWKNIMIGGFILAEDGRPMHASWGNAVDPLRILEEYGADALRYFAAKCALGIDAPFRSKDVKHAVKFENKIWNIYELLGIWSGEGKSEDLRLIDRWIISRYSRVVKKVTEHMDGFEYDKAMALLENFLWHEFADHYLEMIKGRDDDAVRYALHNIGLGALKMLAAFMPHITEEIYQKLYRDSDGKRSIHISGWPEPVFVNEADEKGGETVKDIIGAIRRWKAGQGMPLNAEIGEITIVAPGAEKAIIEAHEDILRTVKGSDIVLIKEEDIERVPERVIPNYRKIGPELKGDAKTAIKKLEEIGPEKVAELLRSGGVHINIGGRRYLLTGEHVSVDYSLKVEGVEMDMTELRTELGKVLLLLKKERT